MTFCWSKMTLCWPESSGAATNFSLGGGGRFHVPQTHLPPNFDFSSDFGHFILKISENLKILIRTQKKILKSRDFWGTSPRNFGPVGGRVPRPPAAASMSDRDPEGPLSIREDSCHLESAPFGLKRLYFSLIEPSACTIWFYILPISPALKHAPRSQKYPGFGGYWILCFLLLMGC